MVRAHKTNELALNLNAFRSKSTFLVSVIFWNKNNLALVAFKSFEGYFFAIDEGNNNIAIIGVFTAFNNNRIAIMNAGIDHGITINLKRVMIAATNECRGLSLIHI